MHGMSLWASIPPHQQRQLPFHAKVKADCWSSLCWSLICSPPRINSVDHLYVNCLYVNCQLPLHQSLICPPGSTVLITSMSIVDPPPGSTVSIASTLIAYTSIINHLYVNRWSPPSRINSVNCPPYRLPLCQSLIASTSILDPCHPP